MKKTIAWAFLAAFLSTFVGCGGGGGGAPSPTSTTSSSTNTPASSTSNPVSPVNPSAQPTTTATNAVPIQVSYVAQFNQANDPLVSVTICKASTNASSNCTTIDNVLVDTESFGLRLFASAIPSSTLGTLPAQTQSGTGATLAECALFGSGYSWGSVRNMDIKIGGEIAQNVPVQVMADSTTITASAPTDCQVHPELATPALLGANGILGIGVRAQDCGSGCTSNAPSGWYYACSGLLCTAVSQPLNQQVSNPVPYFTTDNNGVVVELPPVSSGGAVSATGTLVFGIDTQSNNALAGSGATLLATDDSGDFNATYNGVTYTDNAFFDSGSTFLYFQDSSIGINSSNYYAPSSTLARSVSIAGSNLVTATVDFNVGNATTLFASGNYAFNDIAYDSPGQFDMGMPFFFGRHVYYGISGAASANGVTGPYVAFTSS